VIEDEERPRKGPVPVHLVGQPLDALSLDELAERIAALKLEIARIEAAIGAKQAGAAAAAAFFKS
jgi:uncharacterized small protein (DUF1192 family)